jgi:hypothetical protein
MTKKVVPLVRRPDCRLSGQQKCTTRPTSHIHSLRPAFPTPPRRYST